MSEELDNAVSSLLPDNGTQTTETTSVENSNTEQTQEGPAKADNPGQKSQKPSKYDMLQKSYSELRSSYDRKNQEYVQKIQALEKRLGNYAPYEQFMPELAKVLEEKRKQEQAQKFQQDPLQAQQQLFEQMLNERLAPFQQQATQAQNEQIVTQGIDWMKSTYGEDAFNEVSPYMATILNTTREQHGPEVADLLARNPEHLFTAAFGQLALTKIREFNLSKQAGVQNKTQLAQQSAGVSRPNRISKASTSKNIGDIEKQAFDFLRQNQ